MKFQIIYLGAQVLICIGSCKFCSQACPVVLVSLLGTGPRVSNACGYQEPIKNVHSSCFCKKPDTHMAWMNLRNRMLNDENMKKNPYSKVPFS